jgi:hypothetical protein
MGVKWGGKRKRKPAKQQKGARKGKKPPKPFEGLTRKPVCEQCAAEAERREQEAKREAPPKIERKRGRRQEIDTGKQFCPEKACKYYVCGKHFPETIGTIFYGSSVAAKDIMRAIALLCEGVSPRKIARVFEVDKDTVLGWLAEAAKHSETVIGYMVHNLELTQVQMDELYDCWVLPFSVVDNSGALVRQTGH